MKNYKLTGTGYNIKRAWKDINGRAKLSFIEGRKAIYVSIPESEENWLGKIVKDFGLHPSSLQVLPEHTTALCGLKVFKGSLKSHSSHCKNCLKLKKTEAVAGPPASEPAPKPQETHKTPEQSVTVGKIEPGEDFDLPGVIKSLELTRDRIYVELERLEELIRDLTVYRSSREQLAELKKEMNERFRAARKLLSEPQ